MSDFRPIAENGATLAPWIKGRFRVTGTTASTPEATVLSAEDVTTGRIVTVEVLRPEFAADSSFAAAVRDQAQRLAKPECAHRSLVRVHECDVTDEGDLYLILEHVDGRSLREVMEQRGAFDQHTALDLAIQVGEGLEILHHAGIAHGEVRPEHVVLVKGDDGSDSVKVTSAEFTTARRTAMGLRTRDIATLAYLAPEQIDGEASTETTDVYGLGLLIQELLTAERPSPTPSRARRGLSPVVTRIIDKAIAARPAERYSNLSVMLNDLWTAQSAPPNQGATETLGVRRSRGINGPQPRLGVIVMVLAGAASLAAGAWIGLSGRLAPIEPAPSVSSRAPGPVTVPVPPPSRVETAPDSPPMPSVPPVTMEPPAQQAPAAAPPAPVVERTSPPVAAAERALPPPSVAERAIPPSPSPARPVVTAPKTPAAPVIREERTAETPARARRVETREPAPPPRPAAQRGSEGRSEAGDGAAIIDWLLKDRRSD